MGARKNSSRGGSFRYYNVYKGSIISSANKDDDRAENIKKANGDDRWVIRDDEVEGMIRRILVKDAPEGSVYGKKMVLVMEDESGFFTLESGLNSGYMNNFMAKAPSIDFSKMVVLAPVSIDKDNGKTSTYMTVEQGGEKVYPFFSRDNMGDVPDAKKDEVSGNWDFTDQRKYIFKKVQEEVFPKMDQKEWAYDHDSNKISSLSKKISADVKSEEKKSAHPIIDEEEDDLPF